MGESRRILRLILDRVTTSTTLIITNVVSCRPTNEKGNNRPPSPEEVLACSPKLIEAFEQLPYTGIIYIGKVSTKFAPNSLGRQINNLPSHKILHPAAIARKEYKLYDIKEQALLLNRFLDTNAKSNSVS